MSHFSATFRIVAAVLLTSLLIVIGLFNLRDRTYLIEPWDGVQWEQDASGLIAARVDPEGARADVEIHTGDRLVTFNGRKVSSLAELYALLDEHGLNSTAIYHLRAARTGIGRDVSIQIGARSLFAPKDALRALLAFLHLGIGIFVMIKGSRTPRAFHFYLLCLTAFVVYLYHATWRLDGLDLTVYWLSIVAPILLPALFIHFCVRFTGNSVGGPNLVPFLYMPAAALILLQIFWAAGRLAGWGLPRDDGAAAILDRLDLLYLCAGFLVGGYILWKHHRSASDFTTRQQMKWVSYGTLAGVVPFTFFYLLPVLFGVSPNLVMDLSMLFLGLIPLSFAYAVIHYRLLDVEIIVRRSAAYFIASTVLLTLYLFVVLVLGRALDWVAPEADFVILCTAAMAIALLFAPLRKVVQSRLDRFFYKEQFDDRASLLEFAATLSTEISLGRLARRILERISKTFKIDKAALFLSDPSQSGYFRLTDELGLEIPAFADPLAFRTEELLNPQAAPNGPNGFPRGCLHKANPALEPYGIEYLQDLSLRGRRIGFIGLGQLPHDRHLSTEDLDLLDALAGYAAIAIENASLYRSVEVKALELERLKIYTENILESVNVAVLAFDLGGRITSCNRAFEELYGLRREDIRNTRVEDLFSSDILSSIAKVTGSDGWDLRSPSNIFKLYLETRHQDRKIVNLSVIPMFDATDQATGCLIVMDDISAKVHLEDQLMQAEKLSSLGLLAAGVAHEVNTPITGISSYTQMLLRETPESDKRKEILQKIERQTFRAAEIVNGLLNFARMNGSGYKALDINDLIRDSLSLLDHQMKQNRIEVRPQLGSSLPHVHGNSGKLQQVFINLFLNARDAMPAGGNLRIETTKNDSTVLVDIRDTGIGISQDNVKKIYDPFFTTKATGRGTGLGLSVTYGIVQEHGGRIFVESAPGKGTHFTLKLPIWKAAR